jgi:hypothetical protein
MKLFVRCLSAAAACVEVGHMSFLCARFVAMTAAVTATANACALNNNANNNTRINGWAGV